MTDEELKQARETIMLEKNKLESMEQRIKELEQNPIVNEYIELVGDRNLQSRRFYDCDLEYSAVSQLAYNTVNSNNILVYMGAYTGILGHIELVCPGNAEYILYRDLETIKYYKIQPQEKDEFEKQHRIIFTYTSKEFQFHCSEEDYERDFYDLRKQFLKSILARPQEEVVKELIKSRGNDNGKK